MIHPTMKASREHQGLIPNILRKFKQSTIHIFQYYVINIHIKYQAKLSDNTVKKKLFNIV